MADITVYRSVPFPDELPGGITIHVGPQFPNEAMGPAYGSANAVFHNWWNDFYREQARLFHDALDALPGGTYDQLLILMLERRASILRVRMPKPSTRPE